LDIFLTAHGRLELTWSSVFPFPLEAETQRLGSGYQVSPKGRPLGIISKWFLSPTNARNMGVFFPGIYCGILIKFLEVNLTILWGTSYGWVSKHF
jgi:hypothetical protein